MPLPSSGFPWAGLALSEDKACEIVWNMPDAMVAVDEFATAIEDIDRESFFKLSFPS
jgi:hypothetical protein